MFSKSVFSEPIDLVHPKDKPAQSEVEVAESARHRRMLWQRYGLRYTVLLVVAGVLFYFFVLTLLGNTVAQFWSAYTDFIH